MARTTRRTTFRVALAALLVFGLAVPALAGAKIALRVSPKTPIVDDSITARWRTDRKLKPGYHYEGLVVGPTGVDCASFVVKESKRRPPKGSPMSLTFSPYDDNLNGGPEWCQGKASVVISIAKAGGSGLVLGEVEIRFRAKP